MAWEAADPSFGALQDNKCCLSHTTSMPVTFIHKQQLGQHQASMLDLMLQLPTVKQQQHSPHLLLEHSKSPQHWTGY